MFSRFFKNDTLITNLQQEVLSLKRENTKLKKQVDELAVYKGLLDSDKIFMKSIPGSYRASLTEVGIPCELAREVIDYLFEPLNHLHISSSPSSSFVSDVDVWLNNVRLGEEKVQDKSGRYFKCISTTKYYRESGKVSTASTRCSSNSPRITLWNVQYRFSFDPRGSRKAIICLC